MHTLGYVIIAFHWSLTPILTIFHFTARKSASDNELTEADQNLRRTTPARSAKKVR